MQKFSKLTQQIKNRKIYSKTNCDGINYG